MYSILQEKDISIVLGDFNINYFIDNPLKVAPYSIKRALFFSARAILGHAQVPILKNFIFVREFTKIHFSKLNNFALSWSIFFIFGKYIIHIKLKLLTSFQRFFNIRIFFISKNHIFRYF